VVKVDGRRLTKSAAIPQKPAKNWASPKKHVSQKGTAEIGVKTNEAAKKSIYIYNGSYLFLEMSATV
jgi:hypothetical protein